MILLQFTGLKDEIANRNTRYWFKYIITTPNQLTAAALVIQYWLPRDKVNPGVWIAIFLVVIIVVVGVFLFGFFSWVRYSCLTILQNYLGIELFGELEFWLSSFKVIIIVGIIIFALVIACGGGPDGDAPGFRYWHNPGAFAELYADGALGKFLGFWSVMVNATFAYLGTELVGVTAGEAQNPRRSIPKGMFLFSFFYYRLYFSVAGTNELPQPSSLPSSVSSSSTASASSSSA